MDITISTDWILYLIYGYLGIAVFTFFLGLFLNATSGDENNYIKMIKSSLAWGTLIFMLFGWRR